MSKKLSSEEYLNKKLKPIFNSMTEFLIRESPSDPVSHILINININFII